jgi:hypothetical protein
MKLAVMQPYMFPYIGYFQLINAVDKFVILDDVNFIMRGWITRNRILVNGKEHLFSLPLKKASQNKLIFECEITEDKWGEKFLKTIEHSYNKAPFFKDSFDVIESIIVLKEDNLSKWLTFQLRVICKYLEINTEIINSSRVYSNGHLRAEEKIIDICLQEKADIYYNAIGGKELYNAENFKKNNLELHFLNSLPVSYPQFNNEFVPFLSIIDVMMFNNKNNICDLLNKYEIL